MYVYIWDLGSPTHYILHSHKILQGFTHSVVLSQPYLLNLEVNSELLERPKCLLTKIPFQNDVNQCDSL